MKSPFERDSGQTKTPTDAVTMICEPWLRMWTRGNADMMTLASQRARAYMELPGRLGACHSPADVVREQMHFWQTAAEQYQRCCTDIARWQSCRLRRSPRRQVSAKVPLRTMSRRCPRRETGRRRRGNMSDGTETRVGDGAAFGAGRLITQRSSGWWPRRDRSIAGY